MSEMVERVARAICKSQGDDPDALVMVGEPMVGSHGHTLVNSCRHSPAWMLHSFDAHCAIAAMREPTKEVILAGAIAAADQIHHKENAWHRYVDDDDARIDLLNGAERGYQAMIDAAIGKEKL